MVPLLRLSHVWADRTTWLATGVEKAEGPLAIYEWDGFGGGEWCLGHICPWVPDVWKGRREGRGGKGHMMACNAGHHHIKWALSGLRGVALLWGPLSALLLCSRVHDVTAAAHCPARLGMYLSTVVAGISALVRPS